MVKPYSTDTFLMTLMKHKWSTQAMGEEMVSAVKAAAGSG